MKSARPTIDHDVISSSDDFAVSTSLIHCTVRWRSAVFEKFYSFEVDFPTLELHGIWESPKMHLRNGKSRMRDLTIVRISSTSMIKKTPLPHWKHGACVD